MTAASTAVARAQVIDIAPDGQAVTYAAPSLFTRDGVTPIGPSRDRAIQASDVGRLLADAAVGQHLDPGLVTEVAWRESRFRQAAVSPRDAVGVMQLTAATARELGVDRYDTLQNVRGGAAYLRGLLDRYGGDLRLTLAAYNAGPGAVDRYRGVPPFRETQDYVAGILARLSGRAAIRVTPILFGQ